MGKIYRVRKGDQVYNVKEENLQLALNDGFSVEQEPKEEKLYTVVKGDKEYKVRESRLPEALADGFKKKSGGTTPTTTPSPSVSESQSTEPTPKTSGAKPQPTPAPTAQPIGGVSPFPQTGLIQQEQVEVPKPNLFVQSSIDREKKKARERVYENDEYEIGRLEGKYGVTPGVTMEGVYSAVEKYLPVSPGNQVSRNPSLQKLERAKAVETKLQEEIRNIESKGGGTFQGGFAPIKTEGVDVAALQEKQRELNLIKSVKDKLENDVIVVGSQNVKALVREDVGNNLLKKGAAFLASFYPSTASVAPVLKKLETIDKEKNLTPQFFTGLNKLHLSEPQTASRIMKAIEDGKPLSDSQVAQVTLMGINVEQELVDDQFQMGEIDKPTYQEKQREFANTSLNAIYNSPETVRAILSELIAEEGYRRDQIKREILPDKAFTDVFGMRWNYDADEIESIGRYVAEKAGFDPDNAVIKKGLQDLKDNEGAMILSNSIAKSGYTRELFKGAAEPIRGIASTIENVGKSADDIYVEGQSEGNVKVAEKRLSEEDKGIRGFVNGAVNGFGQFATQAGLSMLGSGAVSGLASGIAGRAGTAALAGDIALADMNVSGALAKGLFRSKDFLGTLGTTYLQAYDGNLKRALNYTDDNAKAQKAAAIQSAVEAFSENILSPIDAVRSIQKAFRSKGTQQGLLKLLSSEDILNQPSKLKAYVKGIINGAVKGAKVAGTEIGEEGVSAISEFAINAYLAPNSEAFQDRDLVKELAETAYETGVTMAIPSLLQGVASTNVNNFSKGALLVAAQNRKQLIDRLQEDKALGRIDQKEFEEKAQIINTAAKANETLPTKADGTKLTLDEKANYVFSRTSEALLKTQAERTTDEAEKKVLEAKIKKQQDFRTNLLFGTPTEESQKQVYKVDGKLVGRDTFIELASSEDADAYDFEVENDPEAQALLRSIGGKDIEEETEPQVEQTAEQQAEVAVETPAPKVIVDAVGMEVSFNGEVGTLEQSETGEFVLNRGEGESDIIIPVKDKTQPTETLEELGIEVLPEVTEQQIKEAEKDREMVGYVTSKQGNEFYVSLANPNKEDNQVGDQVLMKDKKGRLREVPGMTDDVKLGLVNKFLAENNLPPRESLVKVEAQPQVSKPTPKVSPTPAQPTQEVKEPAPPLVEETTADVGGVQSPDVSTIEQGGGVVGESVSDADYANYVDNNIASPELLNSIADKVISREPLSERETAIFSGKTSEINDIIRTKSSGGDVAATSGEPVPTTEPKSPTTAKEGTQQEVPTSPEPISEGTAETTPAVLGDKDASDIGTKTSISPKNLKELYNVNRTLFGQNRVKALASAIVMDRAIGVMAKRAGITKAEMYGRLEFRKASEEDLPQGVKLQVDAWHGSPYQFDKFTTEKIGTGEGAQAFGWGLYFTDLEEIAKSYADRLSSEINENYTLDGIVLPKILAPYLNDSRTKKKDLIDAINSAIKSNKSLLPNSKGFPQYERLKNENNELVKAKNFLLKSKSEIKFTSNRNLYKVSLHKGKTPDQYTWLEWDKPIGINELDKIISQAKKEGNVDLANNFIEIYDEVVKDKYLNGKDLYIALSNAIEKGTFKTDKEASLFLLRAGIDGIKYPAESIARGATSDTARGFNYVVFDENAVSIEEVIKFQKDANNARGAVMVNMDGTAVIYALSDPNVSTPLHEIAHVFEHYLTPQERLDINKWAGTKKWTTETSEKFARGFEKYLADGIAPKGLERVFAKFKQWLTEIYNGIVGSEIDLELNPKMREIYSRMLGEEKVSKDLNKGKKPANKTKQEKAKEAVSSQQSEEKAPTEKDAVEVFENIGRKTKLKGKQKQDVEDKLGKDAAESVEFINQNFDKIIDQLKNKRC